MPTPHPFQPLATAPHLGQLLRQARKARRLTQAAVATRVGLSQNRLSHLELHPEQISVQQLLAWCAAVGLELRVGERAQNATATPRAAW